MSYFTVRPLHAVAGVVAAASLVGGVDVITDQPTESAAQVREVATSQPKTSTVKSLDVERMLPKTKCSPLIQGEGPSAVLTRLMKDVDPQISQAELIENTAEPGGLLVVQLKERNPEGQDAVLQPADSICVIRTAWKNERPVWTVHFPNAIAYAVSR